MPLSIAFHFCLDQGTWSLWALYLALFTLTVVFFFLSPPITTSDTPFETPQPLIVLFRVMALTWPLR